jgi:arsenate reductase-like glutaredoxin family protein
MLIARSPSFRQLGLSRKTLSDSNLIALMLEESRLIRKPIVGIRDDVYSGADKSVLDSPIP